MNYQLFDNGVLRVAVPSGWSIFNGIDSDGIPSSKKLHIYKDVQTESDVFSKAGVTIVFYGKNEIFLSTRGFYDNVEDLLPFHCGSHLWNGYNCTSFGYPYTMLEENRNGTTFQIMILKENGKNKIAIDDEDVRLILESIEACE